MRLPAFFCLSACLSVCLSVSKITQTLSWIWMKCCVSIDVGTWANWVTFQPDPDYSSDAGTGLFSPISYALQRGILLRRKNPTYRYWAPVAAATRGFNMFFCAPSTALLLLISIFDGFSVFIVVSTDVVSLLIVYTTFEKIRMFICIYC